MPVSHQCMYVHSYERNKIGNSKACICSTVAIGRLSTFVAAVGSSYQN